MGGCKFVYAPERRFIARCNARDCGCCWLNLWFGCLRIWPLSACCWGVWLPRRLAGFLLRGAANDEQMIGRINIPTRN